MAAALALLVATSASAASKAEELLWRGQVDQAALAAAAEAQARPGDLDAQELFIDILLSAGLATRADHQFRARVEANPTDPDAHYLLGRAVITADEARASYEKALRLDPQHARSHMGMGAVHTAEGRTIEARDAYARAVELDPTLAEAWLGLVRAKVATGDTGGATSSAKNGLKAAPDEGGLYLALAVLEPATAKATLVRATQAASGDPRMHEALAGVLLESGDAPGALAAAERALAIDPSLVEAARTAFLARDIAAGKLDVAGYQRLAAARERQAADPKGAVAEYDALVTAWPKSALTWLARGQSKQARGDLEGALADVAAAVKLDPDNVEAQAASGLLLLALGRPDDARLNLVRAAQARPWDASLGLALGRSHLMGGDPAAAAMELAAVHQRHPGDVEVVLVLAQAYLDAGQPTKAYAALQQQLAQISDPRLAAALVMAAPAAGKHAEAAALLDQLANRSGSAKLRELAAKLRAQAAP